MNILIYIILSVYCIFAIIQIISLNKEIRELEKEWDELKEQIDKLSQQFGWQYVD